MVRVKSVRLGFCLVGTELFYKTLKWKLLVSLIQGDAGRRALTGFARIPPKLAVSYPNSISPVKRQKQEKSSMGVTMAHDDRAFAILGDGLFRRDTSRGKTDEEVFSGLSRAVVSCRVKLPRTQPFFSHTLAAGIG